MSWGLDDRKEENSNSSLICLFIEKFNWKYINIYKYISKW
jgi:hypothetical protein